MEEAFEPRNVVRPVMVGSAADRADLEDALVGVWRDVRGPHDRLEVENDDTHPTLAGCGGVRSRFRGGLCWQGEDAVVLDDSAGPHGLG